MGPRALAVGWKNARAQPNRRGQGEDRPQPAPERRPEGQPRRYQDLGQVAEGEDAAAVVTVGSLTGDEREGEQREELGQADHPDGERGLREGHGPSSELVHLPRDDDRLGTGGQGAEEPPGQEQHVWPAGQER